MSHVIPLNDEHNRHAPKDKTMRRRQMQPGLKEDVFSLDEGAVVLQWPDRLSKTSAADLKDWLALIGRKIARASEMPPAEREDQEDDSDDE